MRAVALAALGLAAVAAGPAGKFRRSDGHKRSGAAPVAAGHTPAPQVRSGRGGRVPLAGELPHDPALSHTVDARTKAGQVVNRPSLIDYNPVAAPGAIVTASDGMARFTVLSDRLIRMEYKQNADAAFEDRATLAMMNRNLAVPAFKTSESGGVLTITTSSVQLSYTVGRGGFNGALTVTSVDPSSSFTKWSYGQADVGNLLGTIRGLDMQNNTPLNCTQNAAILDNGEFNHCAWGFVSRSGWVAYDDSQNYVLDGNDWWVPSDAPMPPRACSAGTAGVDVATSTRSSAFPLGTTADNAGACCSACMSAPDCVAWVYATDGSNDCYPLAGWAGSTSNAQRIFGTVTNSSAPKALAQNADAEDLYGFFHGWDYAAAIADFVAVSGKPVMVPRYASGVWWSRWYDINNLDLATIVGAYGSRRIPLDVFVLDMDWHTKNDWSGFTFDSHLFPYAADSMAFLAAHGLPVTLNIHDASGVNSWEALFPALRSYLGLPASASVVPFNLVNATVAYAVEDIVLGDLVYNKSVAFFWPDWQQGGTAGGMYGDAANPTLWINHLRCTDRHRIGDNTRAMVLARFGGVGAQRYQLGFSGDVDALTWSNLAYQPYFSATASNVAHGFWSHDIEGPGNDPEMFTRWMQIGAYSGTMRNHDRGMSGGGCANSNPFSCSVVEPWNVPNANWPVTHEDANRDVLQARASLLPYIYNGHRAAFDTGLGLIIPMYYGWPALDAAYAMDANGNAVQYMFGPSMLFSPVVTPGNSNQVAQGPGMATKTTWLPPGSWVNAVTGVASTVGPTDTNHQVTATYAINEVPLWYAAGAVIPYVPLRSLPTTVGNAAAKAYTYLGFRVVPGATNGSTSVYEDDGSTTAYLTDNAFATTTATYGRSGNSISVTIATSGSYPELPASRNYQLHLLNAPALASVTVNGVAVPFNRFGRVAGANHAPPASQWFYDFTPSQTWGAGPVVDILGASTATPVTVVATFIPGLTDADMSGVFGAVARALAAKGNLDADRSTPGSNTVQPAYTSVLASTGGALEMLAGANASAFIAAVKAVPSLLANAQTEVSGTSSPRAAYSLALLQTANSQ